MEWWNIVIALIGISAGAFNFGMLYKPKKTTAVIKGIPGYYKMVKNWCIDLFREKE